MDAFIRANKALILSTCYLLLGILAFGHAQFYSRYTAYGADLGVLSSQYDSHNRKLKKAAKQQRPEEDDITTGGVDNLPQFLRNINEIAHNNEVIIRRLSPDPTNKFKFNLEFVTDYFTFLRFTSELESLDTVVDNLEVHPYNTGKVPPEHVISFSIIPRNNASPLESERLKELKEKVQRPDQRNPFQRFAYDPGATKRRPIIDLTWIYRLGGVGRTPDGQDYATINRRNYSVGDMLDGRKIVEIQGDRVYLEKNNGQERYLLTFRKNRESENRLSSRAPRRR